MPPRQPTPAEVERIAELVRARTERDDARLEAVGI
jgi:hypothetical protein